MRRRATTRRLRRTMLAGVALFAVAMVVVLDATNAFDRAELSTVDTRFEIRGARAVPKDVVVVGIDDVTFDELSERWPFSRRTFAKALRRISSDQPRGDRLRRRVRRARQQPGRRSRRQRARSLTTRSAGNVVLQRHRGRQATGATNDLRRRREAQRFAQRHDRQRAAARGQRRRAAPRSRTRSTGSGRSRSPPSSASPGGRSTASRLGGEGAWIDFAGPARARPLRVVLAVLRGKRTRPARSRTRSSSSAPRRRRCRTATRPPGRRARWPGPEIHANAIETLLRGAPLHERAAGSPIS